LFNPFKACLIILRHVLHKTKREGKGRNPEKIRELEFWGEESFDYFIFLKIAQTVDRPVQPFAHNLEGDAAQFVYKLSCNIVEDLTQFFDC